MYLGLKDGLNKKLNLFCKKQPLTDSCIFHNFQFQNYSYDLDFSLLYLYICILLEYFHLFNLISSKVSMCMQ